MNRCFSKWVTVSFVVSLFSCSLLALAGEPVELFNGRDLTGWSVWVRGKGHEDAHHVFSAQDGMIRVSGQDYGGITTEKSYSNYHLTVEFKWGEKTWGDRANRAKDSGVLIHSFGEEGGFGDIWMKSVEANIVQGGIGDFWIVGGPDDGIQGTCRVRKTDKGMVFDPENGESATITANAQGCFRNRFWDESWSDTLNVRGAHDADLANDWNTMEIIAQDHGMTVLVNGKLVNEITGLAQSEGRIQLQSEGAEIFFRRVTLKSL